ncbi:MAG: 50S ribosomal protein L11 [Candidatus Collierbacteria bacterium GW2011_GWB2_45_17]|uniref:Large ribosomal subunit protein uL11 n=1 Tax=Candidatus Collierbacteria bacterium GW2011_GWB2_45_17 TaxID=1618388 RepID=A0A837IHA8_9BACT|nr:MAG: 50S ribosomal protein L11 [Microgenomates group bacterium GW2011_GWC1_44_23]KKT94683.1 MAG: 50S ribosomal protein L11 [Candidatus Collierbacteria bacterium GW2011_GWA1_45_15]KKT98868.1 MAG: 50S ribosomal protein L11 [Candidatus Collierbacteria bacterium GW2011_GWB2_45_17]HBC44760.1 50S ribosomal protein L11 [Candidatus Collierbacteria bacterium]
MAKKVKVILKLNLPGGTANPAPPVGPALGQHGVNIMEFIQQYNAKTADMKGQIIPALVTIFEDRSFKFELKTPPVTALVKQVLGLKLGSGEPNKTKVGTITADQIRAIAQKKLPDMNTTDINAAIKMVEGTIKSMGITIANLI